MDRRRVMNNVRLVRLSHPAGAKCVRRVDNYKPPSLCEGSLRPLLPKFLDEKARDEP